MTTLTVHLPEALRARATQHGRSLEVEVCEILESAVNARRRLKLGTLLADIGRQVRLSHAEFSVFEQARLKTPVRPVTFESGRPGA